MRGDFGARLIRWYEIHKRDLPWRHSNDPYKVWLSEVILQQTRVNQGLPYYNRFVAKYPDVRSLAQADRDEVFKLWQGLGYYNRAANMLEAAQTLANQHNGIFPQTIEELLSIKGIGPYTAAAIASIAFKVPEPVVDGNVYRVLSRNFGIDTPIDTSSARKTFTKLARGLMGEHDPGQFNQALMEFGALHCKPKNPDCSACIFQPGCHAFADGTVDKLPVKKSQMAVKNRYFNYLVVEVVNETSGKIYLKKRPKGDIWSQLYDFPLLETGMDANIEELVQQSAYFKTLNKGGYSVTNISKEYKHKLTHQLIHARFIHLIVNKKLNHPVFKSLTLVERNKIVEYPVPRLIDRYLKEQQII